MPDFDMQVTGTTVVTWSDVRANPLLSRPHRCFRGTVGSPIQIAAVVGGVVGPADAALDGRLFSADVAFRPNSCPPLAATSAAGISSVQRFTPRATGHYVVVLRRRLSGALVVPFEVTS